MTKAKKTNLTEVVLVRCRAAGEFDSAADCDYVLLDADTLLTKARRAERTVKTLVKEHSDFEGIRLEISYFANPIVISAATLEQLGLSRADLGKLEGDGYVIATIPDKRVATIEGERVECTAGHVDEHTVYWTTYPKHTSTTVESDPVPISAL
jgi:hypothetical protein